MLGCFLGIELDWQAIAQVQLSNDENCAELSRDCYEH
jgi:hypothetical protein